MENKLASRLEVYTNGEWRGISFPGRLDRLQLKEGEITAVTVGDGGGVIVRGASNINTTGEAAVGSKNQGSSL